jgi:hypothetical protein
MVKVAVQIELGDFMEMRPVRLVCAALLAASSFGVFASAQAADVPDYLKAISGNLPPPSATDVATRNVLQLNVSMFSLYEAAGQTFRKNILANHPLILALFSGAGGRMILYKPGQGPVDAPSVPKVYQVMKSLGHSTLAISEVVMPYLDKPDDKSWMASMRSYLAEMKSALETIDSAEMPAEWRPNSRAIIENNIAFMEDSLTKGMISLDALQAFAKKQGPFLMKAINWAASTQVKHWMGVLDGWKKELGPDFDKAYAASNTIYVARQNNVLYSVLAQYFGPEAINDRLILLETISFTTTPEDMLQSMVRIISDRTVGSLFFNQYHLMDYELMGSDARKTIISEMKARGKDAFLPPLVPYGSKQWPTLVTPGTGASSLDDVH